MSEEKPKKKKRIWEKVLLGAVIGGAIGSVVGGTVSGASEKKDETKVKKESLLGTVSRIFKRKNVKINDVKKIPHENP